MLVSIIIPYIKDRGFLTEAIRSCRHQIGFKLNKDYEIIMAKGNRLLGANINYGVRKAKGEYIKICPDDDLLDPECLATLLDRAEDTGADLVCADAMNFGGEDDGHKQSIIPKTVSDLAKLNSIHGGTILYRKSTMPKWDEKLWTCEEWELSLRMAAMGLKFAYAPGVVFHYRHHKGHKHHDWLKKDGVYRFEVKEQIQAKYWNDNRPINTIVTHP